MIHTDPDTGKHYSIITVDDHGRMRDIEGVGEAVGNMEHEIAWLGDALGDIAAYVHFAKHSKQDIYRDLSVNYVPENLLEALQRLNYLTRQVEALDLWREAQKAAQAAEVDA